MCCIESKHLKHLFVGNEFYFVINIQNTAMIFPATIYCTQGKLLVKSIIPQEYSAIREKTAITLLLREKKPFAFVWRKKAS